MSTIEIDLGSVKLKFDITDLMVMAALGKCRQIQDKRRVKKNVKR